MSDRESKGTRPTRFKLSHSSYASFGKRNIDARANCSADLGALKRPRLYILFALTVALALADILLGGYSASFGERLMFGEFQISEVERSSSTQLNNILGAKGLAVSVAMHGENCRPLKLERSCKLDCVQNDFLARSKSFFADGLPRRIGFAGVFEVKFWGYHCYRVYSACVFEGFYHCSPDVEWILAGALIRHSRESRLVPRRERGANFL